MALCNQHKTAEVCMEMVRLINVWTAIQRPVWTCKHTSRHTDMHLHSLDVKTLVQTSIWMSEHPSRHPKTCLDTWQMSGNINYTHLNVQTSV